jgi:hypothetical protein
MAMIRTGGQGHELILYLPSSGAGSPESLPILGCHASSAALAHPLEDYVFNRSNRRCILRRFTVAGVTLGYPAQPAACCLLRSAVDLCAICHPLAEI